MLKNLPTVQKTQEIPVRSLDQEDPLEEGMVTHSIQYFCLENPMDRGGCWATAHGVAKRQTRLSKHTCTHM